MGSGQPEVRGAVQDRRANFDGGKSHSWLRGPRPQQVKAAREVVGCEGQFGGRPIEALLLSQLTQERAVLGHDTICAAAREEPPAGGNMGCLQLRRSALPDLALCRRCPTRRAFRKRASERAGLGGGGSVIVAVQLYAIVPSYVKLRLVERGIKECQTHPVRFTTPFNCRAQRLQRPHAAELSWSANLDSCVLNEKDACSRHGGNVGTWPVSAVPA